MVIISAGIQPNSGIAKEAGLHVGARVGVVVNRHLETEDERKEAAAGRRRTW